MELLSNQAAKSTEVQVEITSWTTGVLVFLVVLWALFGPKLGRLHLTEGSAACLLGLLCGGLLLAGQHYIAQQAVVQRLLAFSAASFFTYLLPPVIFYAGLSIEKQLFFTNLGSILALGIVGTALSTLVQAGLLAAGFAGLKLLRLQDCIALGTIFSATDSVATLQVLNQERQPVLFSLVFGEGVINDATSVVLLGAVSSMFPGEGEPGPASGWEALSGIATTFLYLFTTSLALGISTGMAISCLVVRFAAHGPHHEVALIGLLSYLSYLAAEVLGLSGILSLFCCGLTVSQFCLDSISPVGRTTTLNAFHTMSYICEGIIFIYLGMDALDPAKWHAAHPGEAISLCGALLLVLFIGRAISVLPILFAHNFLHPAKLSPTDMVIIWWSGLMRGAVSVALAYYYFDIGAPSGSSGDRHHSTLIVATLVVVMTTVMLLGAATQPLMQLLVEDQDIPLMDKVAMGTRDCMDQMRGCFQVATRRGLLGPKRSTSDGGGPSTGGGAGGSGSPRGLGARLFGPGSPAAGVRAWFTANRRPWARPSPPTTGFQLVRADEPLDAPPVGERGGSESHRLLRGHGIAAKDSGGSGDMENGAGHLNGFGNEAGFSLKDFASRESSAPATPISDLHGAFGGRGVLRGEMGRRLRGGAASDGDAGVDGRQLTTSTSHDIGRGGGLGAAGWGSTGLGGDGSLSGGPGASALDEVGSGSLKLQGSVKPSSRLQRNGGGEGGRGPSSGLPAARVASSKAI